MQILRKKLQKMRAFYKKITKNTRFFDAFARSIYHFASNQEKPSPTYDMPILICEILNTICET